MEDPKQYEEAIKQDLKAYAKLEKINKSDEFNDFFDLQVTTVTQKMLSMFTGTGPKDWNEFCRIRGEVVAALYPIQQIRGAKVMKHQLQEQLNAMYNTEPN
jgi:hypothetical protein